MYICPDFLLSEHRTPDNLNIDFQFVGNLLILHHNVGPIFYRDRPREVKLDWAKINSVKSQKNSSLDHMLNEYSDIFHDNIGVIPNVSGHLQLQNDVKPIFIKPRQVPHSIKKKVEEELHRWEQADIITKVDNSE